MRKLKDEIMEKEDSKNEAFELGTTLFRMGDDVESYTWTKAAADDGVVEALYECGFLHYMGIGKRRERNMKLAKEIYETDPRVGNRVAAEEYAKAAAQGHTRSHYMLGRLCLGGLTKGEPPSDDDVERGRTHLLEAAKADHAKAKLALGVLYQTGQGPVAPDEAEAVKFLREAALAGDDIAQRKIAAYYKRGVVDSCPSSWRSHPTSLPESR
ncbi:hypothetical protein JL722_3344 [Aureococcus anophagefferens]|nr:hypothetical protein JL722_3344 [Aureococcus anophagefferens]